MKTWIGIAMACLIFSCKKEDLNSGHSKLTAHEKSTMLQKAVDEQRSWLMAQLSFQKTELDIKDNEKTQQRIKTAESFLLSEPDKALIVLQEKIAYCKEKDTWSFAYIQANEDESVKSANGAFNRPLPGMTIYAGYMLFNDGCFHHGTFYVSPTTGYTVFWPDNGYNNNGSGSTGFEDICLDDETFSGLC